MPSNFKSVVLDERLSLIASFAEPCDMLADIGSDHAYLPVYLLTQGIVKHAVITDINEGPLNNGKKTAAAYGVTDRCEFLRGDGLSPLRGKKTDIITICGMGGELMRRMIQNDIDIVKSVSCLILQPQSDIVPLLSFLLKEGFSVADEAMVRQKHLFYHCYKVCRDGKSIYESFDRLSLEFSENLIKKQDSVMKEFLAYKLKIEKDILQRLRGNNSLGKIDETLLRIKGIEERLCRYES